MKKVVGLLAVMAMSSLAFADDGAPKMVLDKVMFQISEKQWVSTQTALVSVTINMTLKSADLVKARNEIMASLTKIAKGEWHLLAFDRSQDSSGLEKLYVQAQARVDQAALSIIYEQSKSVSTPGAQYDVSAIEFKPSMEEIQVIRSKVREQLYQKVNDEIARLNKAYPNQSYSVSKMLFVEGEGGRPLQKNMSYESKDMALMAAAPAPLSVSNEIVLTAIVRAASNRK